MRTLALVLMAVAITVSALDIDSDVSADVSVDSHADAVARADVHADADADADAGASKWDNYMLQAAKESQGTDGELYWLRSAHIKAANGIDGAGREHGVILVGQAGMPPPHRVGAFDLNPPQPPLLHADIAAWINNAHGLDDNKKSCIRKYAEAWSSLRGPYPNGAAVTAPAFNGGANTVHASIKDAFAAVGQGVDDNAKAAWTLQYLFGNKNTCKLNAPLALVQTWATVIATQEDAFDTLVEHYTRLRAYANNDAYDVWALRGWLYATDRAHGHRLVGATGYAADTPGPEDVGAERRFLKAKFMNPLGAGRVFNAPGPAHWGLEVDTVGHVRPRAFGGNLDPLNFVPQSGTGQKFVNAAETLALEFVKHCTGNNVKVRYGVYYGYAGNAVTDRRPTSARTVVDLTANCGNAHHRLGPVTPIPAGNAKFDWNTPTY